MITYESLLHPGEYIVTDGVVDSKFKTVFVTEKNGRTKSMSVATLEKFWKRVDIPNVGLS